MHTPNELWGRWVTTLFIFLNTIIIFLTPQALSQLRHPCWLDPTTCVASSSLLPILTSPSQRGMFRLLPSIRGLYYVRGPFQNATNTAAPPPFQLDTFRRAVAVNDFFAPIGRRVLDHFIYPLANATVNATNERTKILQTMPVAAPSEAYIRMINFAKQKAELRMDRLAMQSFCAGYWIGLYGHAAITLASFFYVASSPIKEGLGLMVRGFIFPGAFVAIFYTGTELFTANTVTMIMLVFHEKNLQSLNQLAKVWGFSFIGNMAGAAFTAFFLSYLSSEFSEGNVTRDFLTAVATTKASRTFASNLIRGVGCNMLVCLATWCVVCSEDGAGKIMAIFYATSVFVVGGFEHITENFYVSTTALMYGYEHFTFGEILWKNWIPVLMGNLLAGTFFTGIVWWYALHPEYTDLSPFTDNELAEELTRRHITPLDGGGAGPTQSSNTKKTDSEGNKSTSTMGKSATAVATPQPRRLTVQDANRSRLGVGQV